MTLNPNSSFLKNILLRVHSTHERGEEIGALSLAQALETYHDFKLWLMQRGEEGCNTLSFP